MTEQGAVPPIVMTRSQDHVEAMNSTLGARPLPCALHLAAGRLGSGDA